MTSSDRYANAIAGAYGSRDDEQTELWVTIRLARCERPGGRVLT